MSQKKEVLSSLYLPLFSTEELFKQKSFFKTPFSLLKNKATFSKVTNYLREEKILDRVDFLSTRHDVHPFISSLVRCTDKSYGGAATFGTSEISRCLSVALGEALERYFLTHPSHSTTKSILLSLEDKELSHLSHFPTHFQEQDKIFPKLFNKKNSTVSCVSVQSLFTKEKKYLPEQYIFYRRDADEKILVNSTSNGGAGHFTKDEAILSGVCEQIERDTFLLYWLSRKTPKKIKNETLTNGKTKQVIENLTSKGINVHILYLENNFNLPCIVTLLFDTRKPYALSIGASIKVGDLEGAISSSLIEATSILPATLSGIKKGFQKPRDTQPFLSENINRYERIAMWSGEWVAEAISFFINGEEINMPKEDESIQALQTAQEKLHVIINSLQKNGISDVLVYSVNSPHLTRLGYYVVKVIIPELLQMYLQENKAVVKSPRLAVMFGVPVEKLSLSMLNSLPHPFP